MMLDGQRTRARRTRLARAWLLSLTTLLAGAAVLPPGPAIPRRVVFSSFSAPQAAVSEPEPQLAQLEPVLEEVVVTAGQDLAKTSLDDYAAMRDDQLRTEAYAAAIRERVSMGAATVLDIGTGPFALLATIAANAGARKVYAIERTPSVAQEAQKFVEDAGLQEVISVISGNSQDVVLPEKVDLIVSELVGNVATGEGVVETIRDARRRFLREDLLTKPEAMIPARCQTAIAPVMYVNHELLAAKGPEFLRPFKLFSETKDLLFLSEPQLLEDFDLCSFGGPGVGDLQENEDLDFLIEKSPSLWPLLFSGFALWPRVVVDPQRVVDIQNAASHWSYVVALMSKERIPLSPGQRIALHSEVDLRKVPYSYRLRGTVKRARGKVSNESRLGTCGIWSIPPKQNSQQKNYFWQRRVKSFHPEFLGLGAFFPQESQERLSKGFFIQSIYM